MAQIDTPNFTITYDPTVPKFGLHQAHWKRRHLCAQIPIQAQAAMLSFNDIYRILAVATLIMVPSFLWMRGAQSSGEVSPH